MNRFPASGFQVGNRSGTLHENTTTLCGFVILQIFCHPTVPWLFGCWVVVDVGEARKVAEVKVREKRSTKMSKKKHNVFFFYRDRTGSLG